MMPFVWSVCPKIGGLTVTLQPTLKKVASLSSETYQNFVWRVIHSNLMKMRSCSIFGVTALDFP